MTQFKSYWKHCSEWVANTLFAVGTVFFVCFSAWAAGISVPSNSRLDVGAGELNVELAGDSGDITNAGVIAVTTGRVRMNGDWTTVGSGYFDAGTGTVEMTAAVNTQYLIPGTLVADGFYHYVHSGAASVVLSTNEMDINGNFSNTAGDFDANGIAMRLAGNWSNTSGPAAFISNGNTVYLDGASQTLSGDSTFGGLEKELAGAGQTITFEAGARQSVARQITMRGNGAASRLNLRSSVDGVFAELRLISGGIQDISDVDVKDNDASSGLLLVARGSSNDSLHNLNWDFDGVTLKWDGSEDTRWDNPFNWNLGLVPGISDSVVIRSVDEDNGNAAIVNQPVLRANVHIVNLEIRAGAVLTLDQFDLLIDNDFIHAGELRLDGMETVTALTLTDSGAFTYIGSHNGSVNATVTQSFQIGGNPLTTFNTLIINEETPGGFTAAYTTDAVLTIANDVTVTEGSFTINGSNTLSTGGTLLVNGGIFTSGAGITTVGGTTVSGGSFTLVSGVTLDSGLALIVSDGVMSALEGSINALDVGILGGVFSAPGAGLPFTIGGDFAHTAGTFTHNNGAVVFNKTSMFGPTNQQVSGSTTFYDFSKTVPVGATQTHTITFQDGATQTVDHQLTLTGLDGAHRLRVRSVTGGVHAFLDLEAGAGQNIRNVDVMDNNAVGLTLVAREASFNSGHNTNWIFGAATIKWDGSVSTDWDDQFNWDLGIVPLPDDDIIIRTIDEDNGNSAIGNQPVLATNVSVGNLTLRETGTTLDLSGHDLTIADSLTVPGILSNNGTIYLKGTEAVTIEQTDDDSGTFVFQGDNSGGILNFTAPPSPETFFNIVVNDINATTSTFLIGQDLTINGHLTVNGGAVDASSVSLDLAGSMIMQAGSFLAPGSAETFTIASDFTNTGGTFSHNNGVVTLDGTSAVAATTQLLTGSTLFYDFVKQIPSGAGQVHRLAFDNDGTQTFAHTVTMKGLAGNALVLLSDSSDPTAAVREWDAVLQVGGRQSISYVDVVDSNASGVALVARDSVDHSAAGFNNTNWVFGIPTVQWDGSDSTDWADPFNWDLGLKPIAGDNVVIRSIDPLGSPPNSVIVNQPDLTALSGAVAPLALVLQNGSTLTLNGFGLTVSDSLANDGNIVLQGDEAVAIVVPDTDSGTFTYLGDNSGSVALNLFDGGHTSINYYNLVFSDSGLADSFLSQNDVHVFGNLNVISGTMDIATGSDSLTVDGDVTVDTAASLLAAGGQIDLNSDLRINGLLSAPGAGRSFTVAGSWSLDAGGTFTHNNGRVNLDTASAVVLSGNTLFYDLSINAPAKSVLIEAGSNQTIASDLSLAGLGVNKLSLHSTVNGTPWTITLPSGSEIFTDLDVRDGIAVVAGSPSYVIAFNSVDSGNNTGWLFTSLAFWAPVDGKATGTTPVLIGQALPGQPISVVDIDGLVVATAIADANGNYRMAVGEDGASLGTLQRAALNTGANSLTPVYLGFSGTTSNITVQGVPTLSQVPVIDDPANGVRINTNLPTITGRGLPGAAVYVVTADLAGTLLLTLPPDSYAGQGVVDGSGNFSIPLTTPLSRSTNYVSVIIDGVSSSLMTYIVSDVYGYVFDSHTNHLIQGAQVFLYKTDGTLAQPGIDIDAADANPEVTAASGFYDFLTVGGQYSVQIQSFGYDYPSVIANGDMPAGRSIRTGSKGEIFTIGSDGSVMDQPLDANQYLFRIEKSANKSEATIGEVVTYTVVMENLSDQNAVLNTRLFDKIPPGFKFLDGRVQLDGLPLNGVINGRPMIFPTSTFTAHQIKTIRYQLVVGSGVAPGNYENTAYMKYDNDLVISNRATQTVKIVMDPLFDAGTVFGKVFYDLNENGKQDDPDYIYEDRLEVIEGPVPNVRLMMEDGTNITADTNGQFHVPGLLPGRHLIRVDERSLPVGAFLTTDKVQVIDITPGMVVKVNFGVNIDNAHIVSEDVRFFENNLKVDQSPDNLKPKLNVEMFNKEILMHNDAVLERIELRIFMNYAPFIQAWKLDIIDKDTKKVVKSFKGDRHSVHVPIFWDGRDENGKYLREDRHYAYVCKVEDGKRAWDETQEMEMPVRILTDLEAKSLEQKTDKEKNAESEVEAREYRNWLIAASKKDTSARRNIFIKGETITVDPQQTDIRQVRVLLKGEIFMELPVLEREALTARMLLEGDSVANQPIEVILPDGDYELEIVSAGGPRAETLDGAVLVDAPVATDVSVASVAPTGLVGGGASDSPVVNVAEAKVSRYRRPVKVGEDYLMFLAMGDGRVGYNVNRGNIEPVQSLDRYQPGFYNEGKVAYYLKGKIKGRYLVTSSFDSERQQKEMFRTIEEDKYYPVYGDSSQINYDATNTQGPLYLMVEWDKSRALWGNYAVDFKDTEFAQYARTLYGGKLDYTSVASNPYGDPKTRVVVFHAEVRQRAAHNEFLGTGGSLYYLKHQEVVPGSLIVKVEVRDALTGQVTSSVEMKENVDYDADNSEGRLLFWLPVSMATDSSRLIGNALLQGDPVYVVADYEYLIKDKISEGTQGARVAQAVGKDVVIGGTYVTETKATGDYSLTGQDITFHAGKDTTFKAEYAATEAQDSASFVSTDGGITFTDLTVGPIANGKSYGLSQDSRLFDRLGLKSYYKWVDNSFATAASTSSQGKESRGLVLTFDVTSATRLTATHDVQRLIERGNAQTQMQVGATETAVSVMQLVHDARRLRLTAEYRHQTVQDKDSHFESETNTASNEIALQAEYDITDRTKGSVKYQIDPTGEASKEGQVTTAITQQLTDKLSATVQQSFGSQGTATKVGATANITPKLALTTDYGVTKAKGGELVHTRSSALTGSTSVGDKLNLQTTYSVTQSDNGPAKNTLGVGAGTQVDMDDATLKAGVKVQADETNVLGRGVELDATKRLSEGRETHSSVKVDESGATGPTATVTVGEKGNMAPGRDLLLERTFAFGAGHQEKGEAYKVVQSRDGRSLETAYTRKYAENQREVTASNIFGLTGDINDRWAANASFERGNVHNLDGSIYNRSALALGLGYVGKDENGVERLKSSTKLEGRLDRGGVNKHQVLLYQSTEGKVSDETTLSGKFEFSQTKDRNSGKVEAQYREIMLGAAYRPIVFDRLSMFGRYTYKQNQGPTGQVVTTDVEQTKMHVVAAEGVYELNEDWQLVEKLAYRIMQEKVLGFEFTKTHTWLLVNRLNYRVNEDWKIGAEYRILTQEEARDRKTGFLLEAVHSVNDNVELGVGYNFTDFVDDLTSLDYTVQGPFIRMTGKLYDRSPEEKARARQKWLDHRVEWYAWKMVDEAFQYPDSPVIAELNQLFQEAQAAQQKGRYEESREIYKDVILGTQLMFEEAAAFVRGHIAFEEKLFNAHQRAMEYFENGDFWQAKKLWQKVVDEAEKAMLQ